MPVFRTPRRPPIRPHNEPVEATMVETVVVAAPRPSFDTQSVHEIRADEIAAWRADIKAMPEAEFQALLIADGVDNCIIGDVYREARR